MCLKSGIAQIPRTASASVDSQRAPHSWQVAEPGAHNIMTGMCFGRLLRGSHGQRSRSEITCSPFAAHPLAAQSLAAHSLGSPLAWKPTRLETSLRAYSLQAFHLRCHSQSISDDNVRVWWFNGPARLCRRRFTSRPRASRPFSTTPREPTNARQPTPTKRHPTPLLPTPMRERNPAH